MGTPGPSLRGHRPFPGLHEVSGTLVPSHRTLIIAGIKVSQRVPKERPANPTIDPIPATNCVRGMMDATRPTRAADPMGILIYFRDNVGASIFHRKKRSRRNPALSSFQEAAILGP